VLLVYRQTIKELIHEQFGDGIMSAVNSAWISNAYLTRQATGSW
jgi:cyanate lyase